MENSTTEPFNTANSNAMLSAVHLAPYLPYGLKLQYVVREKVEKTGIMKKIIHNEDETNPTKVSIDWNDAEHIWMFKPILRPLSDLTKEIEHNGGKFVPIDYNAFRESKEHLIEFQNKFAHYKSVKYGIIERLLEWHFDVFGLIDSGLAIDINTLSDE